MLPKWPIIGVTLLLLYYGAGLILALLMRLVGSAPERSRGQLLADKAMWRSVVLGFAASPLVVAEIAYRNVPRTRLAIVAAGMVLVFLILYYQIRMVYFRTRRID